MKTTNELPKLIKGILNQRKLLLKMGKSQKNPMRCHQYIDNISKQIDAYQQKWDDEGWKRFFLRNSAEIIYLIPENNAGLTIKQKIYESL